MLRATERIRAELVVRQRALQAPRSTYISVVDVRPPSSPEPVIAGKLQAGGVTLGGGIIFGLALAYGIDRWRSARRSRRPDVLEPDEAGVAAELPEQAVPDSADPGEPRVPVSLR